ncbi:MAG: hypothetical protein WEB58_09275 [Planctomycetaceae bacterium]
MHESNSGYCRNRPSFPCVAGVALIGFISVSSLLLAFDDVPLSKEGMLLMKSGKVVSGELNQTAGGYMLKTATGDVLIPFEQIQFEAESLRDAYIKQSELLKPDERTASTHILLARWCLSYQLYEEAQFELREAIRLEPRRTEAKFLLKRLQDNILDPVTSERFPAKSGADASRGNAVMPDGSTQPIQSLAGLKLDNALTYTRVVQPILMNKCGNASCHGQSVKNGFHLEVFPYGEGLPRIKSERNLAVVMEFIDFANPQQSPLLTEIVNAHGPDGVSLFLGSKGTKQQKALHNWVMSVVREKQNSSPTFTELVQNTADDGSSIPSRNAASSDRRNVGRDDSNLDPPELLPDPFDPEAFNRMYHRGAVRSAVYESSPSSLSPSDLSPVERSRPLPPKGNATRLRFR